MAEIISSGRETGPLNSGIEVAGKRLRALEFYISGMVDHPVGMPWASINIKTGQLELEGDSGDMEPPTRLAVHPNSELVESFLRRDGSATFNPITKLLEVHTTKY